MKGGYKVIDFKKVSLASTRQVIAGLWDDLVSSVGKAVLLTNVVLNDVEMDDCFSTVLMKSSTSIKLNCYDGYISINSSGVKYSSSNTEDLSEEIGDLSELETTDKDNLVDAVNEVNTKVNGLISTASVQSNVVDSMSSGDKATFAGTLSSEVAANYDPIGVLGWVVSSSSLNVIEPKVTDTGFAFYCGASANITNAKITATLLLKHK